MARKMAFITRSLLALKPGAEVYEVREAGGEDSRGSGLRLRVHPSGTKAFRWPCRSLNRVFTLGTFGDGSQGTITLAEAHRRLDQYRARVKAGIDPAVEERPRTVKQLCALFYEEEIAKHRKRPEDAKWVLDNQIVPVLGNVPLAALDTLACRRLVTKIRDRGQHRSAAVALTALKRLLRFGVTNGLMERSPAEYLTAKELKIHEGRRDRFLSVEEIPLVLRAVDASTMEEPVKRGLWLLALTGLRTNELLSLEWRDVDLDAATVTVRPENQKLTLLAAQDAKDYVVPLSPPALEHVKALRERTPKNVKWVFYSCRSEDGRLSGKSLARGMIRLWRPEREPGKEKPAPALTIPRATPHDFRRTLATHVSETLGFPPHVGQLLLGHSLNAMLGSAVAATYDRSSRLDERRAALEAYAAWIDKIMG